MVFVKKMLLVFAFYDYWSFCRLEHLRCCNFRSKRLDSVKNDIFFIWIFIRETFFFPFSFLKAIRKWENSFFRGRLRKQKAEERIILVCLVIFFSLFFISQSNLFTFFGRVLFRSFTCIIQGRRVGKKLWKNYLRSEKNQIVCFEEK